MKKNFIFLGSDPDYTMNQVTMKAGQLKKGILRYKIILLVIFTCSFLTLLSQAQQVRIFNTENSGLPHNQVNSIAIDAQGNKWFGTFYGEVVKFDNVNWTVFDSINSGLPTGDYRIASIAIDAQNNKWFATFDHGRNDDNDDGGGLVKFDNTNWTIYNRSNSGFPNNSIYEIAIDKVGNKWVSIRFGGVAKFDDTNWTFYNSADSDLPDDHVSAIAIDDLGNKWFATEKAIAKFDDTNWTIYDYTKSIIPYYNGNGGITSIAFDKKGDKWFGISEDWDSGVAGGVTKFDDLNWTIYDSSNSDLPYSVKSAAVDQMGNIWFATSYWSVGALVKFDGTNWTVYDSNALGYSFDWMESIAIDNLGNKWVTTGNYGVIVFNENGLTVGLDDKISDSSDNFIIYPNPAKDFISIDGKQSGIMEIFNLAGGIVKNSEVQGMPTKVNISDLPGGIYTIRVTAKDKIVNKKFIKSY
jgi:ligand-binding sensor domain-containing protein